MKVIILTTITMVLLAMFSCRDQGSDVLPSAPRITTPGRIIYQPGMVEVEFTKSVSRPDADGFVRTLNLVLFDFSDQNDSTHLGLIEVPIGKEQTWVDSLKTFPAIIAYAGLVPMVYVD